MTKRLSDEEAAAFIAAASTAVDLKIDPEYLPGVTQFVKLAAEMAETLERADLDPDDAPLAPVYRLPEPTA